MSLPRTLVAACLAVGCTAGCTAASTATAAPLSVPVGDTRVVLDAPSGYSDTLFMGSPRLQELAESLTSASNRVLLFALSDADLKRFTVGDTPELRRYAVAVTPREKERERIAPAAFQSLAAASLQGLRTLPAGVPLARHLDEQPVGASILVAELRKDPSTQSLLQALRLQPTKIPRMFGSDEKQNYLVTSNTLVLLRGRIVQLGVFSVYESADDAEWVRSATLRWVEELQRLNNR